MPASDKIFDPALMPSLFRDPRMFDSVKAWDKKGFEILRKSNINLIVAKHASMKRCLFKKYLNSRDLTEQAFRFRRRVDGAEMLRSHISSHGLKHIIVPRKWLYELPPAFSRDGQPSYILVVERLKVLDKKDSLDEYHRIKRPILRELCTILATFKDLDFTARNAPFTKGGAKIAFIDTEYIQRNDSSRKDQRKRYMECVERVLSGKQRREAEDLWREVSHEACASQSAQLEDSLR